MFNRRLLFQGSILLTFSVFLSRMPLFNSLGYECSVAIALLLPFVIGIPVVGTVRRRMTTTGPPAAPDLRTMFLEFFREGVVLLLLPLIVETLNLYFVKNCSYIEGLLFYLLIPAVTLVWVIALALFCSLITRRALLLYWLLLLVNFLYPLYIGYATPQIYSYNFVYGYFPGFSYDELLRISLPLVLSRGVTLLVAFTLVLVARTMLLRRNPDAGKAPLRPNLAMLFVCAILLSCSWVFRERLGFESSPRAIRETLDAQYMTEHFNIFYSQASFSEQEIQRVADEHEFRFHQVATALAVSFTGRVDSYIYPDAETKRWFIGAGNTNIAKPWRKEIHLNKESWDDVLKHELVHVLAGEFGMPLIKAHYNIGLVEGLAMAVDHEFGNKTLEEYAAAILKFGLVSDPVRLVKPAGFATQTSTVSYVMMGSFCKYLIDRYGIVHFKDLYGGGSVEDVYGVSYEKLAAGWERSLDRIDVPASWRRHVEFYFNRPSIFAKECVRKIADLNDRGGTYLRSKDYEAAAGAYRAALATSWNSESYTGLVRAEFGASHFDSVIALVDARMTDTLRRPGIANLFLLYGDAQWYRGNVDAAEKIYEEILRLDLSQRYSEAAAIRRLTLLDPRTRSVLAEYFAGRLADSSAQRLVDSLEHGGASPALGYLAGSIAFRLHRYDDVLQSLASDTFAAGDSLLRAGREELLGEACFMLEEYQQARIHFWQSLNFRHNQASVGRVNDWLGRCEWYEENAEASAP